MELYKYKCIYIFSVCTGHQLYYYNTDVITFNILFIISFIHLKLNKSTVN